MVFSCTFSLKYQSIECRKRVEKAKRLLSDLTNTLTMIIVELDDFRMLGIILLRVCKFY